MTKLNNLLLLVLFLLVSCQNHYDAKTNLDGLAYENLLLQLAPYVNKRPQHAKMSDRFHPEYASYYRQRVAEQQSEIRNFFRKDSVHYFFYVNKDLSSLHEHFRGHGGFYINGHQDEIKSLNILYYTPRWTLIELEEKGIKLFREMVRRGNIESFFGNKDYIHTPNEDFYYNTEENKWDYTPNSSWKFLKEAGKEVE